MQITTDIITARSKPCALALGFFDGVHLGHQAVIARAVAAAREQGLSAAVFTFSTVGMAPQSKKNLTLLQTEQHKEAVMERMGIDEAVVPPFEEFMRLSPEQYVNNLLCDVLNARVLVCGENYRFGKNAAAGIDELRALAQARGIEVITVPPVMLDGHVVSSTRIRTAVRRGDVGLAEQLLGAPFTIEGEVTHGKGLGRSLHSPTVNLDIPDGFTVPAYGVYLSCVTTPLGEYYGATNIGTRPTVEGERPNCETFLLDFDGDLYGKSIAVALRGMLREEKKFDSVDELSRQIQRDVKEVKDLTAEQ